MEKQEMEIKQNGDFKNLYLKPVKGVGGVQPGKYVDIVKAKFVETKEIVKPNWTGYSATFEYNGEEVGCMFFNKDEADAYNQTGGLGDTVRVTATEEPYVNKKGIKVLAHKLHFEKL